MVLKEFNILFAGEKVKNELFYCDKYENNLIKNNLGIHEQYTHVSDDGGVDIIPKLLDYLNPSTSNPDRKYNSYCLGSTEHYISREITKKYSQKFSCKNLKQLNHIVEFEEYRGEKFLGIAAKKSDNDTSNEDKQKFGNGDEGFNQYKDLKDLNSESARYLFIDDLGYSFASDSKIFNLLNSLKFDNIIVFWKLSYNTILKLSKSDDGKIDDGKIDDGYKSLLNGKNVVTFLNARDLRACGANISYRLSWEKTTEELFDQMKNNPVFDSIMNYSKIIIIRIGLEGALVIIKKGEELESYLFFDPYCLEDEFIEKHVGNVQGISSAFCAGFIDSFIDDINELIHFYDDENNNKNKNREMEILNKFKNGIRDGLGFSRRMWFWGYGRDDKPTRIADEFVLSTKPCESGDFCLSKEEMNIVKQDVSFKFSSFKIPGDILDEQKGTWTILEKNRRAISSQKSFGEIAYKIVDMGIEKFSENNTINEESLFPIYEKGGLISVDRSEIESYQSIRNIISEYVDSENIKNPLSITVFGPPGSGKSFSIEKIIESLDNDKIDFKTFNLSQFTRNEQLTTVFHIIRDVCLKNKIPVIFFDEFDCKVNNNNLGWLRFFLAPMQDGLFFDGENFHPIGRSIFVFAGGIYKSYEEFISVVRKSKNKDLKLSDFLSRLKGHINIIGCNKTGEDEYLYKIRRGILLRSVIKKVRPDLIINGILSIDQCVERAFISSSNYYHGARSIQAIVEMSNLNSLTKIGPSALPLDVQLEHHIDAEIFLNLIHRELHLNKLIKKEIPNLNLNEVEKMFVDRQRGYFKRPNLINKLIKSSAELWNLIVENKPKRTLSALTFPNRYYLKWSDLDISRRIVIFKEILKLLNYLIQDKHYNKKNNYQINQTIILNSISQFKTRENSFICDFFLSGLKDNILSHRMIDIISDMMYSGKDAHRIRSFDTYFLNISKNLSTEDPSREELTWIADILIQKNTDDAPSVLSEIDKINDIINQLDLNGFQVYKS